MYQNNPVVSGGSLRSDSSDAAARPTESLRCGAERVRSPVWESRQRAVSPSFRPRSVPPSGVLVADGTGDLWSSGRRGQETRAERVETRAERGERSGTLVWQGYPLARVARAPAEKQMLSRSVFKKTVLRRPPPCAANLARAQLAGKGGSTARPPPKRGVTPPESSHVPGRFSNAQHKWDTSRNHLLHQILAGRPAPGRDNTPHRVRRNAMPHPRIRSVSCDIVSRC
jgi:hypothetical protein